MQSRGESGVVSGQSRALEGLPPKFVAAMRSSSSSPVSSSLSSSTSTSFEYHEGSHQLLRNHANIMLDEHSTFPCNIIIDHHHGDQTNSNPHFKLMLHTTLFGVLQFLCCLACDCIIGWTPCACDHLVVILPRTLFDVLDDDKTGCVALTQIEQW